MRNTERLIGEVTKEIDCDVEVGMRQGMKLVAGLTGEFDIKLDHSTYEGEVEEVDCKNVKVAYIQAIGKNELGQGIIEEEIDGPTPEQIVAFGINLGHLHAAIKAKAFEIAMDLEERDYTVDDGEDAAFDRDHRED